MRRTLAFILAAAISWTAPALGQGAYPTRPITLVVPFAAVGPSDVIARLLGHSMSDTLGQQVVVETVAGAGGTAGAARVAGAQPDGYTLLIHHVALAAGASLYGNLRYDTLAAFEPVGLVARGVVVGVQVERRKRVRRDAEPGEGDVVAALEEVLRRARVGDERDALGAEGVA